MEGWIKLAMRWKDSWSKPGDGRMTEVGQEMEEWLEVSQEMEGGLEKPGYEINLE